MYFTIFPGLKIAFIYTNKINLQYAGGVNGTDTQNNAPQGTFWIFGVINMNFFAFYARFIATNADHGGK